MQDGGELRQETVRRTCENATVGGIIRYIYIYILYIYVYTYDFCLICVLFANPMIRFFV